MHWFVFFLGACLTVAGGASLVSSIDLIGVERGTVLAVAGTIALTGGVLTLALGFLLMSLRQLSGRLRETGPVKTYTGANGEKASAYPEMASAAAGIAAHEYAGQHESFSAAQDGSPAAARYAPEPAYAYPEPAPPPAIPAPYAPAEHAAPSAFIWPRAEYAPAPTVPEAQALPSHDERAPRYNYATNYAAPEAIVIAQTHDDAPPSTPDAAQPYAPEPTIVGRYNAGGAAYVMFSDGSIEAETTSGHFRFKSMSELKAFIEGKPDHSGEPVGARNPEIAAAG